MTSFLASKARDFIKTNQNPDGGWGYRPGAESLVEPTGVAALALHAGGDRWEAARALDFLKSCQKGDGAVGLNPRDTEGNWMAYAALLAFHLLGASDEERRLRDWILGFEDASGRFTPADLAAVKAAFRYDASIRGWPWTPGTTGWVEPTALFILALCHAGVPSTEKRIKTGIDLILDRKIPSGGWNFGNPYSRSFELEASPMSTALALAALGEAGVPENHPAVGEGLRFLVRSLGGDISAVSLTWALLAFKSFRSTAATVRGAADRLGKLQEKDGSFRANLFETALAFLVLSDTPILKPRAWTVL